MNAASVELTHALAGWATGSLTLKTEEPPPPGALVLRQEVEGDVLERAFDVTLDPFGRGYGRSERDATWTEQLRGYEELLDTIIEEELLIPAELTPISVGNISTYSLDAELGSSPTSGSICPERPTFAELARRALEYVGITLVILDGPGLPFNDRKVDYDYTTQGKTVQQVLSDTLLVTQPRWWGDGLVLYVDGRGLEPGTLSGIQHMTGYSWRMERGQEPPEPVLDLPSEGEGSGDTLETAENASYGGTERQGSGDDYQEISYLIQKSGGQITFERERRYGYVQLLSGKLWTLVYEAVTARDYHPACSQALVSEVEVVRTVNTDTAYWDFVILPGPAMIGKVQDIRGFLPPMIETSRKTVKQTWHAEGWLKSRVETTLAAAAYAQTVFGSLIGEVAYKKTTRTELNLPIGNGMWLTRVTEHIPSEVPVYESSGSIGSGWDYTATYPVAYVNSYTRQTDGPPPSVSCGAANDPCRPDPSPAAQAIARHAFEAAKREAVMWNNPPKLVHTVPMAHLALNLSVGDVVGGLFVASIRRSVGVSELGAELELWSLHEGG